MVKYSKIIGFFFFFSSFFLLSFPLFFSPSITCNIQQHHNICKSFSQTLSSQKYNGKRYNCNPPLFFGSLQYKTKPPSSVMPDIQYHMPNGLQSPHGCCVHVEGVYGSTGVLVYWYGSTGVRVLGTWFGGPVY